MSKYKIGDLVRVKTWYELEAKYGMKENTRYLNVPFGFTREMEEFSGEVFKITDIDIHSILKKDVYKLLPIDEYHGHVYAFMFSEEMLDPSKFQANIQFLVSSAKSKEFDEALI